MFAPCDVVAEANNNAPTARPHIPNFRLKIARRHITDNFNCDVTTITRDVLFMLIILKFVHIVLF